MSNRLLDTTVFRCDIDFTVNSWHLLSGRGGDLTTLAAGWASGAAQLGDRKVGGPRSGRGRDGWGDLWFKNDPGRPQTVWGGGKGIKGIGYYKCHDNGEVHEDDEADDDDGDDDDDDEEEEEEDEDGDGDGDGDDDDDMMRWMLRTRRKMMMLRRRMLRRKTDPKTGKHTLCEPAQSKCTWTGLYGNVQEKMPDPNSAASILCEPAQSKCTWTFHKSHFVWTFTGKMPDAPATTSIKHRAVAVTVRTPSVWPHCLGKKDIV